MDDRGDTSTHSRQQVSSGEGSLHIAPKFSATRPIWFCGKAGQIRMPEVAAKGTFLLKKV